MSPAPFAQWVTERFPQPEDALTAFFDDAKATAASVGCTLEAVPALDQAAHYLPNLEGKRDKRQYVRASIEQDPDGTFWPCLTFKTFRHGGSAILWKPRDLAWQEFQRSKGEPTNDNAGRLEEYRAKAARRMAEAAAKAAEREADEQRGREAAAKAAASAWETASDDASAHPYLVRKGVGAHGVRVATQTARAELRDGDGVWKVRTVARLGDLLIPLVGDDGQIRNLQRIAPDDTPDNKRFVTGGQVSGLRHCIPGAGPAWLAEGYATAASVHAATGAPVVTAFTAGNLSKLKHLAERVAADNDMDGAGQKAAEATGLPWIKPEGVKDWNDYAAAHGLEATAAALAGIASQRNEARREQQKAENAILQQATVAALPQPLDKPLEHPEAIYHPDHIVWKRNKETGEWEFHQAKGTSENLLRLIRAYGIRIRYNELSRDLEISVNGKLPTGDLARNGSLSMVEDLCRLNDYPYTAAAGHLDNLASRDAYNPALEWVKSRQWDGGEHIRALFDCLTLADQGMAEISWTLFRKWFLGAVAILSGKANKFEHVLVLVDPMGGLGKTRFFNTLCPKEFQADGVTLKTDDKDSVLQVVSKWIVELGEIGATFSKSDIESLKAFLSRESDELRPAYARAANRYQRRTAFFGSVNNVQFLMDDTNNRRFWPIQVAAVNYQHQVDVQQAWAEALARVERGEAWHLDQDENRVIGEHNEAFRSKDFIEERILSLYDTGEYRCRYVSASDVLEEIGLRNPKQTDTRKASALLRKLFPHKLSRGLTVYHMPSCRQDAHRLAVVGDRYGDRPY